MKELKFKNKKPTPLVAFVDDDDFDSLNTQNWHIRCAKKGVYYVFNSKNIGLHNIIMGIKQGGGLQVYHINYNPLDNRKENLEIVTRSENIRKRNSFIMQYRDRGIVKVRSFQERQIENLFISLKTRAI